MRISEIFRLWYNRGSFASITLRGTYKLRNEDAVYFKRLNLNGEPVSIGLIVDGVSSGGLGYMAARQIVSTCHKAVRHTKCLDSYIDLRDRLLLVLKDLNLVIYQANQEREKKAYAAFSLCLMSSDALTIVQVGDTSAYLLNEQIQHLTHAHKLIPSGVLTNAIGLNATIYLEVNSFRRTHHNIVLLATDGLSEIVSVDKLALDQCDTIGDIHHVLKTVLKQSVRNDDASYLLMQ